MVIRAYSCTESEPATINASGESPETTSKHVTQEVFTFPINPSENTPINNTFEAKEIKEYVKKSLNLEDDFLKPSIIEENGKYFLKLSRDANDKLRAEQRHQFNMGAIKRRLGIEDGVLNEHNNLADVTGRKLYANSDSGTIECGKSLKIPLEDLGQTFGYQFTHLFSKDITDYVEIFLNARN